jgi:hypothetical protein
MCSAGGRPSVNLIGSFMGSNVRVCGKRQPLPTCAHRRYGSTSTSAASTKATAPSVKRKATGALSADLAAHAGAAAIVAVIQRNNKAPGHSI